MNLKRFFVDTVVGDKITLYGDEFYHAVKVTRHKIGYSLIICDNSGYDFYATVMAIEKDKLVAKVDKKEINNAEIKQHIHLFVGLNKDIDTVVQKAVELGIGSITPFYSQHTSCDKNINIARLQRIILESSKQCGRAKLMQINNVVSIEQIAQIKNENLLFFYEKEQNNKIEKVNIDIDKPMNIIIGGEGGFSDNEVSNMVDNGAETLTLGKRVLRVSTAVVSAITLVLQKIGEM